MRTITSIISIIAIAIISVFAMFFGLIAGIAEYLTDKGMGVMKLILDLNAGIKVKR